MQQERKCYQALRDLFVGSKDEGEAGYADRMRIPSRYDKPGVFPSFQRGPGRARAPFPDFREDLFDTRPPFSRRYSPVDENRSILPRPCL